MSVTADEIAALMNAVPMPLVLIGQDESVVSANSIAEKLFARTAMVGRHYITVLRQPAVLDCVETALRGRARDTQFPTRDGVRDITLHVRATPVDTDLVRGVLVSFEDVSDMQDATQMRRDFVANVSHELRTPLTALLGFIETLRGPAKDDPKAQARFLEIMEREANRMSRLIRDLLSLSRVESEARVRPTDNVDVASIVTSAVMTLGALAQDQGVAIHVTGADDSVNLPGDSDQLLQVFTNLVENAIKYGGTRVDITITKVDRDPNLRGSAVRIEVVDDGPGIDPLHQPRLTERFYRVDDHRSREVGGTGLGLAIVKHIVNRHRGRLRLNSEPGTGTSFAVILPAEVR